MVRMDPDDLGAVEELYRIYGDIGVDEAIVNFPSPHDPDLVPRLAEVANRVG